jgi:hypothetical protein
MTTNGTVLLLEEIGVLFHVFWNFVQREEINNDSCQMRFALIRQQQQKY